MTMEQKLHELLCAYALGEADAAQKTEVERALASSPEVRAELAKLEETIGLVRETLGGSESMSEEAEHALMSAVSPAPRANPWYSSGWMRLAASFLVVGGGALWMHRLYEANEAHMAPGSVAERDAGDQRKSRVESNSKADPETLVAQLDQKEKADRFDSREANSLDQLSLGSGVGKDAPPSAQAASVNFVEEQVPAESAPKAEEALAIAEPPPIAHRSLLSATGYAGNKLTDSATTSSSGPVDGTYRGSGDTVPAGGAGGDKTSPAPAAPVVGSAPAPTLLTGRKSLTSSGSKLAPGNERPNNANLGLAKKAAESAPGDSFAPYTWRDTQASSRPAADDVQDRVALLLQSAENAKGERLARLEDKTAQLKGLGYTSGELRDNDEATLQQLYFKLSPAERAQVLDHECRRVFDSCRRRPNEAPRDMFFRYWGDNPFEITALDPLSTFSADVDTASYALARRYLVEGRLPEKAQIRTEEFVNYFKGDVPPPTHGTFAIHTDLAPTRFAQPANSTWTLRVVVRGEELAKEERKPLHLSFVIDCSGSMREQNRMETVKDTLRLLLTQLNAADQVGIVAFSTEARQILPLTSVANRGLVETAIGQLEPDGWTNSEAGLRMGYETALAGLDANSTNRVIFLSDGVANKGETDPSVLAQTLKPIREKGVYLNTIGVGMNNHNDTLLEQLADKGDGMCSYVDDMREAKRVMLDNFMGSVETIARDVKIQVEFDPAQVTKYRLLGYENRAIADADFRNDKVDAGEVGSGHQVTALYEIERNLANTSEKPLAVVHLRWKAPRIVNGPANEEATEITQPVLGSQQTSFEGASIGYRRAVIVGQFAEFLRRSVHARGRSLDELIAEAHKLEAQMPQDADFHEFVALVERSKQLVLDNLPNCDELCQAIDAYRICQIQHAQAERLDRERQQQIVDDLARQNREMEEKIRELLRRRLENSPK
ncbi:MAG: von Willebrand factor type A domain-containing protein [Planctomycetes bacterium]|nr:von Willebrand factor type A domain-containing protein [Planctomycetota bacterium]